MPTGYTSEIYDGKEVRRNDFIMRCARAFGATILMRDEPLDTPIPESFKANTYAKDNLDRAKQQLQYYEVLSDSKAREEMEHEYQEALEKYEQRIQQENELKQRYLILMDEVETWTPPSEEHAELKKFCINQLKVSIENDCNSSKYIQRPILQSIEKWRNEKATYLLREISYYEKEWQDELKRTESRNTWVKLLRESLKNIESNESAQA